MSQDPHAEDQGPTGGQPPSLHKGPESPGQYPPAPGQQPEQYPSAAGPLGYGPGPGYAGQQQQPRNGLGVAALVLGIASIPLGVFFFPVGIVLGVLAIIFGAVGMTRAKRGRATNRGVALAGLITGVIGTALGIVFLVLTFNVISDCSDELGDTASSDQFEECVTDELTS